MEDEAQVLSIVTAPSSPSDHDSNVEEVRPDLAPVASPDLAEVHPSPPSDQGKTLFSDDLRQKIIKQVEYYFSDENLPNDSFLLKYVMNNAEGFVPIGVVASFRKMKKLTSDTSSIVAALKESTLLVVSPNGKRVKRIHPILISEVNDPMACTVLVENLPEDHSVENLRQIFSEAGKVKNITIRNPHGVKDSKKLTVAEKLISGKLHALVEYENVETAEKAVATLNNEHDWRYGLRVKLLKKLSKLEQKKKYWRDSVPEMTSNNNQISDTVTVDDGNRHSSEQHDESPEDEGDDHSSEGKNRAHLHKEKTAQKGRNRGRGRRQKYLGTNVHGFGVGAHGPGHGIEHPKPPPGPRMPDGTRGFTMGRGRPLHDN